MTDRRVKNGFSRETAFTIEVDGETVPAHPGETIAAAMLAAGRCTCRFTAERGEPRGIFCGIGLCHECLMVVDGVPNTRTCQTLATAGCKVKTQAGHGE